MFFIRPVTIVQKTDPACDGEIINFCIRANRIDVIISIPTGNKRSGVQFCFTCSNGEGALIEVSIFTSSRFLWEHIS